MKVKIKTKSNYRSLNGEWLEVHEAQGTRISGYVPDASSKDGKIVVDFAISEITEIKYNQKS